MDLDQLETGLPGYSRRRSSEHYEAAIVCLTHQGHASGVPCALRDLDSIRERLTLTWGAAVTDEIWRSWEDQEEATEEGATGIAMLVLLNFTDYAVIRRSAKPSGIDYYLDYKYDLSGHGENVFRNAARLEVSGIRKANRDSEIRARVREKLRQTRRSDRERIPAYVAVTEFSRPVVYLVRREAEQ